MSKNRHGFIPPSSNTPRVGKPVWPITLIPCRLDAGDPQYLAFCGAPPARGVVVSAGYTWYYRVRFGEDAQDYNNFMHQLRGSPPQGNKILSPGKPSNNLHHSVSHYRCRHSPPHRTPSTPTKRAIQTLIYVDSAHPFEAQSLHQALNRTTGYGHHRSSSKMIANP